MRDLITGVHACVGAARAHQVDRVIGNLGHGLAELGFHRSHAGFLELPTMEIPAVVLEGQRYPAFANGFVRRQCLRLLKQWSSRIGQSDTRNSGPTRKCLQVAGVPFSLCLIITNQDRFLSKSCASVFCSSLPSSATSSRMSFAPSTSPIST